MALSDRSGDGGTGVGVDKVGPGSHDTPSESGLAAQPITVAELPGAIGGVAHMTVGGSKCREHETSHAEVLAPTTGTAGSAIIESSSANSY